jgi:hypothetical protein
MFADPQSVTVNAVAESLPRIDSSGRKSVYRSSDSEFTLTVSHDEKNRCRRTVRLTQEIVAADPFLTDVNRTYVQHAYVVLDHPKVGFTATQIDNLAQGLVDYLSDANIDKVIAGES